MRVVGGSTIKPTSRAKKQEAIEAGQVIGQFADAAPVTVEIMLKMFEQAFDEIVIKDEDWERIRESIALQQQQAGSGPGGETQSSTNGTAGELPPEAEQAVQTLVQQGLPEQQARQAVAQRLQQRQ
jgi:hypothetical protein